MFEFAVFLFLILQLTISCPPNSLEWQSSCYSFFPTSAGFADAEFTCQQNGGHLASVHDGFTNAWLAQEGGKNFTKSTESDFWIGATNLMNFPSWNWTDGSAFDFKDWKKGEPQNVTGSNCASISMSDGLWSTKDCFQPPKPFICKIPTVIYPVNANCTPDGWSYFPPTGACYGVAPGSYYVNWTASNTYCENFDAYLPAIHSYAEFRHVLSYVFEQWIMIWTGIYSLDGGHTWTTTTDKTDADFLKYKKWCPGCPQQNATGNRCVTIDQRSGIGCYYDHDCDTYAARTLCKKQLF